MTQYVDIFELCKREEELEGEVPVKDLPQLCTFLATDRGVIKFAASGEGEIRGLPAATLSMEGDVDMFCARCNKPVTVHIESEAVFRFVKTEAEANALPIEDDEEGEDVAVGSRHFDLEDWVEEEAILSLPRMAVHEDGCEEKPVWEDESEAEERSARIRLQCSQDLKLTNKTNAGSFAEAAGYHGTPEAKGSGLALSAVIPHFIRAKGKRLQTFLFRFLCLSARVIDSLTGDQPGLRIKDTGSYFCCERRLLQKLHS